MEVKVYTEADLPQMINIWNEIVEEGRAFPQMENLDQDSASKFFASQSYCGVAKDEKGHILGLYILHPNNVGRCGHIANASYAVPKQGQNQGIGKLLVQDSLKTAKELGFRIMQFNAVVSHNMGARHLYEKLGFNLLGQIPGGFKRKGEIYDDICLYYKTL